MGVRHGVLSGNIYTSDGADITDDQLEIVMDRLEDLMDALGLDFGGALTVFR